MALKVSINSVIWQMRIAMLAIGLLVLVLLGTAALGLSRIDKTQTDLTERTIPSLAGVELLDEQLRDLVAAIDRLRQSSSLGEHKIAQSEARALITSIGSNSTTQTALGPFVAELGALVNALAEDRLAMIANQATLARIRAAVYTRDEEIRARVEQMTLDAANRVELGVLAETTQRSRADLARDAAQLNTLTNLMNLIEKTIDYARLLDSVETRELLDEFSSRVSFHERAIVRLLTKLPDGPDRAALVAAIRDTRSDLTASDGLIATQVRYLQLKEHAGQKFGEQNAQINTIFQIARAEIANARAGMQSTAAAVGNAVDATGRWLQLVGIVVLALLATIAFFLVERRIVQRLSALTVSVREIAGGDTDHAVTVTGDDELGQMSQALETFKSNSRELLRSNDDLERFAYAASHDLRSPLRAIRDLAEWTLEDAGDALSEDCQENLRLLISRAERLSKLLGNMLDYSRAGQETASIASVDIRAIVDETLELVGGQAVLDVSVSGNSVTLYTFETPLRQILLNLISNALKHHDRPTGTLNVTCNRVNGRLLVSLSDDGPGIPLEYQTQVFAMFETLQSRDEVEGSGMGLAIIRKIVERYGGSIGVESDPENRRGTTFVFDWPYVEHPIAQRAAAA